MKTEEVARVPGISARLTKLKERLVELDAERAGIYVSGRGKGSAVLSHAANAATDQTLTILILG